MPRVLVFAVVVSLLSLSRIGAEPVRFARTPDISPDGKWIVFSYQGDLWVVERTGGEPRHLTMHEKHDFAPVFSPDGKHIAFSSNRHGQYDVFVVPIEGGKPRRLTYDSGDDFVTGWTPDGQYVVFSSTRHIEYPPRQEVYKVRATGGQAVRLSVFEGREAAFSPKGDFLAYTRGPGAWYRKGYRGSSNDDIWIANADGSNNRQLTSFNGQDNHPQWSPDGKVIYYVSECLGTPANIVRQNIAIGADGGLVSSAPVPVTFHKEDSVRRMRMSANGDWLIYECGPDLYVLNTKNGAPQKLNIEVHADERANSEKLVSFVNNVSEYALSHDEKFLAFIVQGEIFVVSRTGVTPPRPKRLTENPAFDHGVAWAPDSKKILFLSDRSGHEDIYLLESDDPESPELLLAHRFKVKQLTDTPEAELGVMFTPDGKRVSFLRAGQLWTMNPDGTDQRPLIKDGIIFDYEWSPDGKWLVYARQDAHFASELFIVPGTGPTPADPPRNVTRFATYNGGVTWSKTGNKLAFISNRQRGLTSAFVLALEKPAAPGVPPGKGIDWDDIHLRVKQPAQMAVFETAISQDGTKIAFRATVDKASDLWVASTDGSQVTRLTTGDTRPTQIQWSRLFPSFIYFRDGKGQIRSVNIGVNPPVFGAINLQVKMEIRQDELFQEMFDQGWRALLENFYDPKFHGTNWVKIREKYRPLVKHVAVKEDLYALVSLMLGELNASHLGISGELGKAEQETADLGLLFDPKYPGPGLRILEVVRNGPADRRGLDIKPGDLLLKINYKDVTPDVDTAQLLNDRAGETVVLHLTRNAADPKATRKALVQAVPRKAMAPLMYDRWVRKNAEKVEELSKGKLGYVHIQAMSEDTLDRFLRTLYSDCFDKDGLVIDVRYNPGGHTHEQILSYLAGKEHTFFHQRLGGFGHVLNSNDRRWTKPMVLLINNRSFSDAEIFPHAFRTMGLGKLIGQPTGGHVIGTRNITLIDGSLFRTPRIGVTTHKGVNMDKEGVTPDILVNVHPDDLARGIDPQLARAVEVLEQDVVVWRKNRPPVAGNPLTGSSGSGPNP